MFQVERTDDNTFTLVSDDANAENDIMGQGIDGALPHLLRRWEDTPLDDEGILRFPIQREDWEGLLDALEIIESAGIPLGDEIEKVERAVAGS